MLNAKCRKRYNEFFDAAERAVAADTVLLRRVRRARLPLQYSELEIARTETGHDPATLKKAVALFDERTREYGVPTLNERNNPPSEYCRLYLERFLPGAVENKAKGSKVIWNVPPTGRYAAIGDTALTDGLYGGTTYVESWVGWEGVDASFVLDMGESKEFTSIASDFLHQLGAWVLLPEKVVYSVSSDGIEFTPFGEKEQPEDRDVKVKFVSLGCESPTPVKARYIKVDITGVKTCPSWHYGVGHPAWFFLDEVTVN